VLKAARKKLGICMSYCVFVDLDETLIKAKSMMAVINEYYHMNSRFKLVAKIKFHIFKMNLCRFAIKNPDRNKLNRFYYEMLAGFSVKKITQASQHWIKVNYNELFNFRILEEIKKHRDANAEIIIVTGSFIQCVKPIADYLRIQNIICTELEVKCGHFTGNMLSCPVIGEGKAKAINQFVQDNSLSLSNSYAYGDHDSDIPMLSLADNPVAVGNNKELIDFAKKNKWLVIN
jgi:HAD superfamily hydrolase (TIGR01490 family)